MHCNQLTTDYRHLTTATYSPSLGRFTQPDTIVPDLTNTQSWNRYSYVSNNPVNFNDPTGQNEDGATGGYGYDFDPLVEDIDVTDAKVPSVISIGFSPIVSQPIGNGMWIDNNTSYITNFAFSNYSN